MSELAALGVSVKRRYLSAEGNETAEGSADMTELVFSLPKSTGVEATFDHEGLGDKLLKLFKKEIQVGDPLFDDQVHVKTDTPEQTTRLLESSDMRAIIERVVVNGGAIEIDGASVKMEIKGRQITDDEVTLMFLRALLGR
jgi:hypothetical protein